MSAPQQDDSAAQAGRAGTAAAIDAAYAADGATVTDGAAPTDTATTEPEQDAPAPLTSLTSLLGGSFEGGAACAADGTCD